ncbi:MAG TPA: UDP-2,3-diacylglucosamine diphosphatase LpxI [Caulobacteraceae bacterium]|nr:UDP-2,3-diacylglucosamine diphosphatase LpxI [Caulobacteraceae bacterium]
MEKLGLIAGGGALPVEVAQDCVAAGRHVFVIRLIGFADEELQDFPGAEVGLAELGKCFKLLKKEGCRSVCFAGQVHRPDFKSLKPDLRGLAALPGAIAASRKGDDALLRFLLHEFEKEGFKVEGAQEVAGSLALAEGPLGRARPTSEHQADIERAMLVAREIGRLDIGQGAVVVRGLVLAVEAQEGTDAMLRRCAELPANVRGTPEAPCGVLAKAPKPIQERRVDLPTIGLATVQRAAKAGLAGIVGEAGALLVLDKDEVIEAADEMGLFIVGLPRPGA